MSIHYVTFSFFSDEKKVHKILQDVSMQMI